MLWDEPKIFFLERRYFFSIILSEFLKNRVALQEESRAGTLTAQKIENSVAPTKREIDPPLKVTFQDDELRPYFPDKGTTVATVKRTMFEAMDLRKKALERQKMKMQTEKEPKKKSEPER